MIEMDADAFEALVSDELDLLPERMLVGLDNVVFVVEDRPEDGSLDLLGLYDGLALTERDRYGTGSCPTGSSSTVSRICTPAVDRGAARRGAHHARPRDRALLRDRRRAPARVGLGMTIPLEDVRLTSARRSPVPGRRWSGTTRSTS
jgi:hypothetical protein